MRILLVEDNPKLGQFIADVLTLEGYQVTVAGNGLDELRIARESQPNLLILDWMLPELSGLDLRLNRPTREVYCGSHLIELIATEFDLL